MKIVGEGGGVVGEIAYQLQLVRGAAGQAALEDMPDAGDPEGDRTIALREPVPPSSVAMAVAPEPSTML